MSFSEMLANNINKVVNMYVDNIAKKYNLNKQELLSIWNNIETDKTSVVNTNTTNLPSRELEKCGKPELITLCKEKKLKCTGTKAELVARLVSADNNSTNKDNEKENKKIVNNTVPVVNKLLSQNKTIAIRRNKYGNYEHPETSLIFNNKTQKVIGKQNDDGTIADLTLEDIDICNQYKFIYDVPNNLDKKANPNVKVDDLDSDVMSEEDEIIDEDDEDIDNEEEEDEEFEEEIEEDEMIDH